MSHPWTRALPGFRFRGTHPVLAPGVTHLEVAEHRLDVIRRLGVQQHPAQCVRAGGPEITRSELEELAAVVPRPWKERAAAEGIGDESATSASRSASAVAHKGRNEGRIRGAAGSPPVSVRSHCR